MMGLWYRRKLRGTREASNGGRVSVGVKTGGSRVGGPELCI